MFELDSLPLCSTFFDPNRACEMCGAMDTTLRDMAMKKDLPCPDAPRYICAQGCPEPAPEPAPYLAALEQSTGMKSILAYANHRHESYCQGNTHIRLTEPITIGRITRTRGQVLCTTKKFWQLVEDKEASEPTCPKCLQMAQKYLSRKIHLCIKS